MSINQIKLVLQGNYAAKELIAACVSGETTPIGVQIEIIGPIAEVLGELINREESPPVKSTSSDSLMDLLTITIQPELRTREMVLAYPGTMDRLQAQRIARRVIQVLTRAGYCMELPQKVDPEETLTQILREQNRTDALSLKAAVRRETGGLYNKIIPPKDSPCTITQSNVCAQTDKVVTTPCGLCQ